MQHLGEEREERKAEEFYFKKEIIILEFLTLDDSSFFKPNMFLKCYYAIQFVIS